MMIFLPSLLLFFLCSLCTASNAVRYSKRLGGNGGKAFDDAPLIIDYTIASRIVLSGNKRLDAIGVDLVNRQSFWHGGTSGSRLVLQLKEAEYWKSLKVCQDDFGNNKRIFYAEVTTSGGRSISVGQSTEDCLVYDAPASYSITGLFGNAGEEVDNLGAVYTGTGAGA